MDRKWLIEERDGELEERREQIAAAKSLTEAQRKEQYMPSPEFLEGTRTGTMREYEMALEDLCYRWGVCDRWGGELEDLETWAFGETEIFFREPEEETASISLGGQMISYLDPERKDPNLIKMGVTPRKGSYWASNRGQRWAEWVAWEPAFIYLKITPTTQRDDVIKFWHMIESLKRTIWGFSERAKPTFERNLCFWDLKNRPDEYGKLSSGDILQKWNAAAPTSKKVRSADTIKKAVKQIQNYIDRLTPQGYAFAFER